MYFWWDQRCTIYKRKTERVWDVTWSDRHTPTEGDTDQHKKTPETLSAQIKSNTLINLMIKTFPWVSADQRSFSSSSCASLLKHNINKLKDGSHMCLQHINPSQPVKYHTLTIKYRHSSYITHDTEHVSTEQAADWLSERH